MQEQKAQSSAFVHLKAFTEQTHRVTYWRQRQSVCPTLRLEQQF